MLVAHLGGDPRARADAAYDGLAIKELAHMALAVSSPDPEDDLIARLGDPAWSSGCTRTSSAPRTSRARERAQLCRAAVRLRGQRSRPARVGRRAAPQRPGSRSATITTFEPLSDTSYIPCVSLLDFWAPAGRVELVVYAHSLDFGKKAYGNLVELARLQELVAGELGLPLGSLTIYVKSAHVYEPEWA